MRRGLTKILVSLAVILTVGVLAGGNNVHAEEVISVDDTGIREYIYREASQDMEELAGYELSDEEAQKLIELQEGRSIQWSGNTEKETFLSYGSDYGYRDMLKRSNSAGRQSAYTSIGQAAYAFTLSDTDCTSIDLSGNRYYLAATIDVKAEQLSSTEILEVYFTFRNDNPQYFWLSNRVVWGSGSIFVLTYDVYQDGGVRSAAFQEILQTAEEVYASRIGAEASDYGKVKTIHDALIADIEYSTDVNVETAHSIAGAMTGAKSAVCEGYAKVMQLMMNAFDVPNIYVTGYGGGGAHAWNMVQMPDEKYYWLDATWDDQIQEIFRHQYFLVGDLIFTDHIPDSPEEEGSSFLYELPEASQTDYDPEQTGGEVNPNPDSKPDPEPEPNPEPEPDPAPGPEPEPEPEPDPGLGDGGYIRGDVTGDTVVDIQDLRMVLRAVCGKVRLEEQQVSAADITGDGTVDISDLRMILRYVCGKLTEL